VAHRSWVFEYVFQLGIVLFGRAAEARRDQLVAALIELPPRPFEVEHVTLAVGQLIVRQVHRNSLTRVRTEVEDGGRRHLRSPATPAASGLSFAGAHSLARARATANYLPNVTALPSRPFLIGVAGGSSSGKTTVAERLAQLAPAEHLALIKLDSYYVEFHDKPIEERRAFNYDHPDAFDWPLLNDHLAALAAGASIPVPVYDYVDFNRTSEVRIVHPAQIVVVEGILVLWEPSLRERFDLKVFLDTDADLRFIRRLQRDVADRGRSPDSVIAQYLDTVRPAHEQFIEPSKRYADVIIPNGGLNRPALDVLLARVRELAV
jgi:uridine kinase